MYIIIYIYIIIQPIVARAFMWQMNVSMPIITPEVHVGDKMHNQVTIMWMCL